MPGWQPLIVCDGVKVECDYAALTLLAKNLITDLVLISTLVAAAAFIWCGFLLITSGGNEKKMTDVKTMLWKVLLGYMWILGAWLVVYTITSALLDPSYSFLAAP